MSKILLIALAAFFLAGCSTDSTPEESPSERGKDLPMALTPAPLEEDWALSWWIPRHEAKLVAARQQEVNLLFLGDSITQGWEDAGAEVWEEYYGDRKAFNLGFSGDRTENVLWRLEHGEVASMNPELVVLMIGTNNTGHREDPAQETAAGVAEIIKQLQRRLPEAEVLLLAVFPRGATADDPLRRLNDDINQRLEGFGEWDGVHFLDINSVFLDQNGDLPIAIMPDHLHPNEEGYRLWADAMEPELSQILGNN